MRLLQHDESEVGTRRGGVRLLRAPASGLGYEVARSFLAAGASVGICARDAKAIEAARDALAAECSPCRGLIATACNVASEAEVSALVGASMSAFGKVDIVVNNAGTLGPMGRTEDLDLDEFRQTIEVNLYGVLHMCRAVVPDMRTRGYGKILNLSGGGATGPRPFFSPYAISKTGVVRLTENLAAELQNTGIDVNAIAPGALNTRMLDQTLAAGREKIGEAQYMQALAQREKGGSSMSNAAELCVYLASAASDGITGRLISAAWDPWPRLHDHLSELADSDIYTLRRIVPEDRSKNWH